MGDISRRAVLGGAVGAVGAVALGAGPALASTTTIAAAPLRATYLDAIGRVFTVEHGGHSHRVKLTDIHDLSPTTAKQRAHSFILIFAPVGAERLPDAIYRVRRRGVATHRLFLSSVGTDRGLQAVINRQH